MASQLHLPMINGTRNHTIKICSPTVNGIITKGIVELFREVDNEACVLVYILLWCKGEYIRCLFTFVLRVEVDTVYRKS